MDHVLLGPDGHTLARAALDALVAHNLTPTPKAYEVFLCHAAKANPSLSDTITKLEDEQRRITDQTVEALYARFFNELRLAETVMMTSGRVSEELIGVERTLKTAEAGARAFGDHLNGARGKLGEGAPSEPVLRTMIDNLVSATVEMEQHTLSLERRLVDSCREVNSLREALNSVRAEAFTDALTGVSNRKYFDVTITRALGEDAASGKPVSLLMGDIDFFKRVNDTWGHSTGDQVIRFVANTLTRKAWPQHVVARIGGEEFAVVMPDTTLAQATAIAEDVRMAVQGKRLIRRATNEDLGQITMSFGVASYRPGDSERSLIERADESLYASKRNGRNRVTTDSHDGEIASAA